jgi:hypothetical protein
MFTIFNQLPPELREKIWISSLKPRIIALRKRRAPSWRTSLDIDTIEWLSFNQPQALEEARPVTPPAPILPPIYYVCRESQAVVERLYTRAFKISDSPRSWTAQSTGLLFNFDLDILYLNRLDYGHASDSDFYELYKEYLPKVKNVAISGIWTYQDKDNNTALNTVNAHKDINQVLRGFKRLKRLILADANHRKFHSRPPIMTCTERAQWYSKLLRAYDYMPKKRYRWPKFEFAIIQEEVDEHARLEAADSQKRGGRKLKIKEFSLSRLSWGRTARAVRKTFQACRNKFKALVRHS